MSIFDLGWHEGTAIAPNECSSDFTAARLVPSLPIDGRMRCWPMKQIAKRWSQRETPGSEGGPFHIANDSSRERLQGAYRQCFLTVGCSCPKFPPEFSYHRFQTRFQARCLLSLWAGTPCRNPLERCTELDRHREEPCQYSWAESRILTSSVDMTKARTHCDLARLHIDGRHGRYPTEAWSIEQEVAKGVIGQRLKNGIDVLADVRMSYRNASVPRHWVCFRNTASAPNFPP